MAETTESPVDILVLSGSAYYVQRLLQMYPALAAAIRAAGAYVVVFAPPPDLVEDLPTAESVAQRTRAALADAVRAVSEKPGVPLLVASGAGCYFYLALLGEHAPLVGLTAERGLFVGFVDCGEGGATFYTPDGHHGRWEMARDVVMRGVAELASQR